MRSTPTGRLTGAPGGLALADGLQNAITGAGTRADKNAYNRYVQCAPIDPSEVEAAYRTSWLVRKVHDLPPLDMTREWRDWQAEKADITKLEAEERRLGLKRKVKKALLLARLHGGGALILGTGDRDPAQPISPNVGKGGLKYVNVVSRYALGFNEIDRDPQSEFYGQPKQWVVNSGTRGSVPLHPSRVIAFVGQPLPDTGYSFGRDGFWGDPLLESIKTAMSNADLVQNGIAALIHEAKTDIFGIPGLMDLVGTEEGERRIMRRLEVAQLGKSMHNAYVRDAAETWEQKSLTFQSLPDVAKLFLMVAAGACDIPATRLLGKSADGMNATGEGDEKNYYAMIATKQEDDMADPLDRIDALLIPSALGAKPAGLHWTFAPLDEPTEAQKADVGKKKAETTQIYSNTGLVPHDALAMATQNQLIEDGNYPGLEQALEESAKALDVPSVQDPNQPVDPNTPPPKAAPKVTAKDAEPRTLYVSRKVVNASEIIAWAKAQGFDKTVPASELHVTVAYSRQPVDWMKVGDDWNATKDGEMTIPPGGARLVEVLGDKGAVVLMFASSLLSWRHEQIKRDAGASWDFESYQPHITITYQGAGVDLSKVEPYRGKIVLGPEVFEEIVEDWENSLTEA